MSIILDALKKAQKERSPQAKSGSAPAVSPIIPSAKKSPPLLLIAGAGMALLILLGSWAYVKLFKQGTPSVANRPALVAPKSQALPQDAGRLEEEALRLFRESKFEESKKLWEKITAASPQNPEAFNNLGVVERKLKNNEKARAAYDEALKLKPDYPEALNNLGVLLMQEDQAGEAEKSILRAIDLNPAYGEAHLHLAQLLEKKGNFTGAKDHYKKFLELSLNLAAPLKNQVEMKILLLK